TSQGCNSCPPADRLLGELAARPDVLAISFNVDYWDYLGWKDTLGRREWTERQRSYARSLGSRSVYTPQLVIGGAAHVVGSDRARAETQIAAARGRERLAELRLARPVDGQVAVEIAGTVPARGASLWLVQYEQSRTVSIGRGENGGRTLTYHHVATGLHRINEWRGGTEVAVIPEALRARTAGRAAVFLQEDGQGPILAALLLP
ncbi:MAG: DUF1223 domain-containing protein, partial [Alphaproteobacteria bacterium]|nr:DUF1223 domain-containing protein [Alphaproteobacteria bacterium]